MRLAVVHARWRRSADLVSVNRRFVHIDFNAISQAKRARHCSERKGAPDAAAKSASLTPFQRGYSFSGRPRVWRHLCCSSAHAARNRAFDRSDGPGWPRRHRSAIPAPSADRGAARRAPLSVGRLRHGTGTTASPRLSPSRRHHRRLCGFVQDGLARWIADLVARRIPSPSGRLRPHDHHGAQIERHLADAGGAWRGALHAVSRRDRDRRIPRCGTRRRQGLHAPMGGLSVRGQPLPALHGLRRGQQVPRGAVVPAARRLRQGLLAEPASGGRHPAEHAL